MPSSIRTAPAVDASKCVYVARNPKDVAVSFFHHYCLWVDMNFSGDWDDFFELFINEDGKEETKSDVQLADQLFIPDCVNLETV